MSLRPMKIPSLGVGAETARHSGVVNLRPVVGLSGDFSRKGGSKPHYTHNPATGEKDS